jgi:hypothetical protein
MGRIVSCSCAAILAIICEKAPAAHAEISLISAWQHCEPTKGCMKFAFMPNGHVIEQYPLAGSIVTARGDFHVRGDVLEIGWHRFEPAEVCAADDHAGADSRCVSTGQDDLKGPFHFEGLNALLWSTPSFPPLRLVRIQL